MTSLEAAARRQTFNWLLETFKKRLRGEEGAGPLEALTQLDEAARAAAVFLIGAVNEVATDWGALPRLRSTP